jgi:hypothetical protein
MNSKDDTNTADYKEPIRLRQPEPTNIYSVDWDKVQAPQDLVALIRAVYPNISINITRESYEKVKHLLIDKEPLDHTGRYYNGD